MTDGGHPNPIEKSSRFYYLSMFHSLFSTRLEYCKHNGICLLVSLERLFWTSMSYYGRFQILYISSNKARRWVWKELSNFSERLFSYQCGEEEMLSWRVCRPLLKSSWMAAVTWFRRDHGDLVLSTYEKLPDNSWKIKQMWSKSCVRFMVHNVI